MIAQAKVLRQGRGCRVYGPARRLSGRSRVSEGVGIEELMEVAGGAVRITSGLWPLR